MSKDMLATLNGVAIPLEMVTVEDSVLVIDIEKAWYELDLQPGWSNELSVQIIIQGHA